MGVLSDSPNDKQLWLIMSIDGQEFDARLRFEDEDEASDECAKMNSSGIINWVVRPAYGPED